MKHFFLLMNRVIRALLLLPYSIYSTSLKEFNEYILC